MALVQETPDSALSCFLGLQPSAILVLEELCNLIRVFRYRKSGNGISTAPPELLLVCRAESKPRQHPALIGITGAFVHQDLYHLISNEADLDIWAC